jgi:hypothetical protein
VVVAALLVVVWRPKHVEQNKTSSDELVTGASGWSVYLNCMMTHGSASVKMIYFFTQPFGIIIIHIKLSSVTVLAAKCIVNSSVFGMCFKPCIV